jgi:hypothetical protein
MKNDYKWKIKNYFSKYSLGHKLLELKSKKKNQFVSSNTDLVIEGFPRCGNTYAVASFKYYLDKSYNIASHRHEIGNIRKAVQLCKPTFIIIRNPLDAVCSLMIRENLSLEYSLDYYLEFHKFILENHESLTIISFEDLVKNSSKVVQQFSSINLKKLNGDPERHIKTIVEQMEMNDSGLDFVRTDFVGIPSEQRKIAKKECQLFWDSYIHRAKKESLDVYAKLLSKKSELETEL